MQRFFWTPLPNLIGVKRSVCGAGGHGRRLTRIPDCVEPRTIRAKRRMGEKGLHVDTDGARLNQVVGSSKRATSESPTLASHA
jgi:hypothetical protein